MKVVIRALRRWPLILALPSEERPRSQHARKSCRVDAAATGLPAWPIILALLWHFSSVAQSAERPWLPSDSLSVRYFALDMNEPTVLLSPRAQVADWMKDPERRSDGVVWSPDRRHFILLSRKADFANDRNVFTLHAFNTREVRTALNATRHSRSVKPEAEVTVAGAGRKYESPILGAQWERDSSGVLFRALTDRGHHEAYRLDIATGTVKQLTNTRDGFDGFEYRSGLLLYYIFHGTSQMGKSRYPVVAPDRTPDGGVVAAFLSDAELVSESFAVDTTSGTQYPLEPFSDAAISPDGRAAILKLRWSDQFALVKFHPDRPPSTAMTVAADPEGPQRMYWTPDSRHVIFVGIRPVKSRDAPSSPWTEGGSIAALDVDALSWKYLRSVHSSVKIESVEWSEVQELLSLTRRVSPDKREELAFRFRGGDWSPSKIAPLSRSNRGGSMKVEIRENENTPPIPVAHEGTREIAIMPPDPALKSVYTSRVQPFTWRDPDGQMRSGGLMLPKGYRRGQAVPVIIQLYFYLPELFRPDGYNTTSDAAQALAARGLAVLQIETADLIPGLSQKAGKSLQTEGPDIVQRIDAVVDALVEHGITTPTQVAMSGFSRSGYYTHYFVTHPHRTRLAAAVIADAFTMNYSLYLESGAQGNSIDQFQEPGRSFWEDTPYWLGRDVTFNADRIATPLLFSEGVAWGDDQVTSARSFHTIGALVLNRKPFDYLYFRGAAHQMQWPLQRLAMMSAVVDWMAFWLLDEEDPSPAKSLQNQRWREIRKMWVATQAATPSRGEAGFLTTRTGIAYAIRKRVSGRAPSDGDRLTFDYKAKLPNGEVFGNNGATSSPLSVTLGPSLAGEKLFTNPAGETLYVGKAWDEALRLMHAGEEATFIMPLEAAIEGKHERLSSDPRDLVRFEVQLLRIDSTQSSSTPNGP